MRKILAYSLLAAALTGCASAPTGPRIAVMPTPGKPFEVFVGEDLYCRSFAAQSTGQTRDDSAAQNFAGAAILGTVIGAAAGALGGGHDSAGAGAAAGLVLGSMVGAGESSGASWDAQRRYDIAYQQCMYSKGNQVPGYAMPRQSYYPPPPPAAAPGTPPAAAPAAPPPPPAAVPAPYPPPR
ncbi:MAG: hypothetical protein A3F73_02335 [Gallionellales bacterium RIFCSPLOWO2_12_FULL_59_22]|nr:MAG: hypothetical protein A3H99_09885 [Gallionellales bacterium RIFCSPLOWO2_02_FULL_59_110]OGT03626.1 MAG: hypothetical protein A2Z65_10920 [Gallionellales bacterium RIFCSPLOWO2_02_58_13]OGT12654.1 MAG: hypothetical protein A3F73_02335 [Gallionellales bacterium RIFCSPLOWO2_12_FULL_59_22]